MTLTDAQIQNAAGALFFAALSLGYALAGLNARRVGRISRRVFIVTRAEDPRGFRTQLIIRCLLVAALAALSAWFAWEAR